MAKTLKAKVRQQLWWIAAGLLCACLVLVALFSWLNIQVVAAGLVRLEAQTMATQLERNPATPLPRWPTLAVYRDWHSIPVQLRRHFNPGDLEDNNLLEAEYRSSEGQQQYIFLLRHNMANGEVLFLLSQHSAAEIDELIMSLFSAALLNALVVTGLIFVLLFIFISWLVRRAVSPIALLSRWAQTLGTETERVHEQTIARFDIEELNQLAAQLHCAIDRIRRFNEREKKFLKHASHELRTPLAIIQTSLDTLNMQKENSDNRQLQRALRASANMVTLSNTLLWLARESKKAIAREEVELVQMFTQVVDEHRYLLAGGEVGIDFAAESMVVVIEKNLLQIVIANLVRNAFQHSGAGKVKFEVKPQGLSIRNALPEDDNQSEVSFGLGNELVKRISDKMGWYFELIFQADCAQVELRWQ